MNCNITYLCTGFIEWLEKRQMPCFYKSLFGVECPGCGMQRSIIALLRGEFVESFKLYPALISTVVMLVFLVVHLFCHLKNGAKILVWLFVFNTVIVVASYLYKIFV